jgi:hypothetical protein
LWFTNTTGNSIERITTTGKVTSYTGTGISGPDGITAGPDGALWFTNGGNNTIGRITTTGQVTAYIDTGIDQPQGITAGPDGAMWFTNGGGSIGRITTNIISTKSFAGYQATVTAGSATSSAASFTVPALSCTTAARAIGPDAGVAVNNDKTSSAAGVITGCVNGKTVTFPWLAVNGTTTNYTTTTFSAGDLISLSAKVTTAGTTVQVTDVTTGVTKKLTGPGASASAAWIGDDPAVNSSTGALLGVPNFGTLTFTNGLIDGKALTSGHPAGYLRANAGIVQIAPGALSPAGTAFTTYYNHS